MTVIKLRCIDGGLLEVDAKVAEVSRTLRLRMNNLGVGDGVEIPLPLLDSAILDKVLEWAERHQDDPLTEDPEEIRERTLNGLTDWDKEFLNVDQSTLLDMILAANYLAIKPLVDAACKTLADLIGGKTTDDIRAVMGIENFSPEEEQRITDEIELAGEVSKTDQK